MRKPELAGCATWQLDGQRQKKRAWEETVMHRPAMIIRIHTHLDYQFDRPTDVLLQIEAADIPEQKIIGASISLSRNEHFTRVEAQDSIGERIWLRTCDRFTVDYRATVSISRLLTDCVALPMVLHHQLPAETVQYLMPSRYCPSDQFENFVDAEFGNLDGGAKVIAIRQWVHDNLCYVPGVSTSDTTAADTFIRRQGVCRDYAHVVITLLRAAGIPSRMASVYALGVKPQDFHAVAEVFIGGGWHLVDATGMAQEAATAKIGIGRDAADVAFLTTFGTARMNRQSVWVEEA